MHGLEFCPNGHTGHAFTIKLSTCKLNLAGVKIRNAEKHRATRAFRIFGILEDGGPWVQLLQEELYNHLQNNSKPTLQTFYFKEAVEMQFLRFDMDSYWGGAGGGLNFFQVVPVSGHSISSNMYI